MAANPFSYSEYEDYMLWQWRNHENKSFEDCASLFASTEPSLPRRSPLDYQLRYQNLVSRVWTNEEDLQFQLYMSQRCPWKVIVDNFSNIDHFPPVTILQCQLHVIAMCGSLADCLFSEAEDKHLENMNRKYNFDVTHISNKKMINRRPDECHTRLRELGWSDPADWTVEDREKLESALLQRTGDWNYVFAIVPCKTKQQIQQRINFARSPLATLHWSLEEDQRLRKLVPVSGYTEYGEIADRLPGRNHRSCEDRIRKLRRRGEL
ncbi:hypothetical protein ACLMJK_003867 [Lecanora helva]